ncbi:carbohydrate ABC transporter permease [Micromonospora sp. HUAS LYJ1]|uniref:carbohydrate ABC transporter permease n=1 Tax=Micromonospora sp. HUAS LYJ1 TaxID=3061626 RepID=UPI002671D58F|nr:ABC transporter permease subunit [Micromonospora sp. HUAS LYJ1]WKU05456.1 ABC transporter permease subunit [Micromonospora sp. HUAS LYJ1]
MEGAALFTVILVNIWRGFPFAMLVYWARMQGIDKGQYEAARVDGAGPWREFLHVTLPNLRSATLALLALRGTPRQRAVIGAPLTT